MPAFQSAEQLLRDIGGKRERLIINYLFVNKHGRFDVLADLLEGDERFLHRMIAKSILVKRDEWLYLDDRILSFLERFLEVNEDIQNYEVDEKIGAIALNIRLFQEENAWKRKEVFLQKVKKAMSSLGRVVKRNVIDLGKQVQMDYKTEVNPKVKEIKISEHNNKAVKLRKLIEGIEDLLENRVFFQEANDEMLNRLSVELRYDYLRDAKVNLRELSQEIVGYLNRIQAMQAVHRKLQEVKRLKDLFELEKRSNVEALIQQQQGLFFAPRLFISTPPSLEFLRSDQGHAIISKVANKLRHRARQNSSKSGVMAKKALDTTAVKEARINYFKLQQEFFKGDKDLFQFLLAFPFETNGSLEDRVKIFCKMALMYEDRMFFTGITEVHESLRYGVILPRDPRKSKSERIENTNWFKA